jgi:hydrogenase expression/formation protein HypE
MTTTLIRALEREPRITMKHGGGGNAMRSLIGDLFARGFEEPANGTGLAAMDDGATFRIGDEWLVLTTDSHVIQPLFFPGGDIGRLSISGTVNDLAMMGATEPLGLTCSIIIEDGFPLEQLERIHASMLATCREAGTTVVTGDTKVMGRGEVDGVILNTTGVGLTKHPVRDNGLQPGDAIIVTGSVGDHGMAIMTARHGLGLDGELTSDVAPINLLIARALNIGGRAITSMKDPTRGGVASALAEMAAKSGVGIIVDEPWVPIRNAVRAAAEIIGIDPLQVANEGKALLGVHPGAVDLVLAALRGHPLGQDAVVIGRCIDEYAGSVILDTGYGRRLLVECDGEPLPRIC